MTATANVKANVHATGNHKDMPVIQRLRPLLADYPAPCLSLYKGTHRQFPDSQQNLVRYRNLVRELKTALGEKQRNGDADALLEPFERLTEEQDFWAHPQDGIAVFAAAGFFRVEKVQRKVPELVAVPKGSLASSCALLFRSR